MNIITCFAKFLLLMFCVEAADVAKRTMTLERPGVQSQHCVEYKNKKKQVVRGKECARYNFFPNQKHAYIPTFEWCNIGPKNDEWDYCTEPCPAPYKKVGLRCLYLGMQNPTGLTQEKAEQGCQKIGGNVAEIPMTELSTVIQFLEEGSTNEKFWVALSEAKNNNNEYRWKFSKTDHNPPTGITNKKKFTGCMTLSVKTRGFVSEVCDKEYNTYICQRGSRTLARPGVNSKPCVERREKFLSPAECGQHYSEMITPQYEWCWVGLGPHDWDYCTDPCVDVEGANGVSDSGNHVFKASHVCNHCTTDREALAFANWRNPENKFSTTVFSPYRHSANNGFTEVPIINFNFVKHTCDMITPVIAWDCPTKYVKNQLIWSHCTEISTKDAYCTVNHEPHYLGHFLSNTLNCKHKV